MDKEIRIKKMKEQCSGCKKAGWIGCCNLAGKYHKPKEIELVDTKTDKDLEDEEFGKDLEKFSSKSDEEELSDCCGAEIVEGTFCKSCKEHCK